MELIVRCACGWQARGTEDEVVAWAAEHGYDALTLATYRDVPWNGPFYASEGFVEVGPVDDWLVAHGRPPEEPIMGRFGVRVLMCRPL